MLEGRALYHIYRDAKLETIALRGADIALHPGVWVSVMGPSGSGKSTLAAGLIGQGYDFLADDLVALAEPDGAIVPWPLPLSIKQGSIEVIHRGKPGPTPRRWSNRLKDEQ